MAALGRLLRQGRSAEVEQFAAFLAARGAYLAQKTVLDYCAVKLGVNWNAALHEPAFTVPLTACRWRTYLAAQGDVAVMAESWLRPAAARPASLPAPLAAMAGEAIRRAGPPAEFAAEAEDAIAALGPRLVRAQLGPARPPNEIELASGPVLLATLPIHPDLRKGETAAILGALRMHLVSAHQDLERRFDPVGLAAALGGLPR